MGMTGQRVEQGRAEEALKVSALKTGEEGVAKQGRGPQVESQKQGSCGGAYPRRRARDR